MNHEKVSSNISVFSIAINSVIAKVEIKTPTGVLEILPIDDNAIRVKFSATQKDRLPELVYVTPQKEVKYIKKENREQIELKLSAMTVLYDKKTDALRFLNKKGETVLKEIVNGRTIQKSSVQGEHTFAVSQRFFSPSDEYLYGTGQFQDGNLNVRGLTRRLTQVNTQISIPMILSNKGYALLWNNYGMADFNPSTRIINLKPLDQAGVETTVDVTSTHGNVRETRRANFYTEKAYIEEDGYYSIFMDCGQKMARKHKVGVDRRVIIDCNNLWLPPTTSFKYYLKKGEHEFTVEGDRNDKPVIGLRKVIEETEWRSPVADGIDYTVFVGTADEAIASYRKATGGTPMMPKWALGYIHCRERYTSSDDILENVADFKRRDIPLDVIVQDWQWWGKHGWNAMRFDEDHYPDPKLLVDSLHKQDVRLMLSVWSKIDKNSELGKETESKGYYIPGTDWIDFFNPKAAEFYWQNFSNRLLQPYKIDAWWQDATEPENDDLVGRRINNGTMAGERMRNIYPLFVNKTVYEGLRKDDPERRQMILTRCGFPGIQRYAAATWSGDVGNDFPTLYYQIMGGLGQMAAGLPWWTFDAGGFFRPADQYDNMQYKERYIRWLQVGTFLPLMRTHGYMSQTEPWRYGDVVETIATKFIKIRKQLMPYIYSEAARVSREGYTLMRPMVMDFPDDEAALNHNCQYMFGSAFLVAPITSTNATSWTVYLPKGEKWIDFWTRKVYDGGQNVEIETSLDMIPLFVKAGSIVPTTEGILIYPGKDADFTLYEDDGVTYNYEKGDYAITRLHWDNKAQKPTKSKTEGRYPSVESKRNVLVIKTN